VARSEPSDQEMSSYAAAIAASMADVADRLTPGAVAVEGPGQMHDRSDAEESDADTADIVPLTARNDLSTPHIAAALLVDEARELARDEAAHQRDGAQELARQLQEERDELARQLQGITVVETAHALPAGHKEEVAIETTGSSSCMLTPPQKAEKKKKDSLLLYR
jgi:hypothetical protein